MWSASKEKVRVEVFICLHISNFDPGDADPLGRARIGTGPVTLPVFHLVTHDNGNLAWASDGSFGSGGCERHGRDRGIREASVFGHNRQNRWLRNRKSAAG